MMEYNQRAINCYKKVGFKEFGRKREAKVFANRKYDIIYMDILAEEYQGSIINDLLDKKN